MSLLTVAAAFLLLISSLTDTETFVVTLVLLAPDLFVVLSSY